jgi:opacity protein-like surface antigen
MFGARASARIGPFVEFGQILVGVVHASGSAFGTTMSSTHLGAQVGGGLDYPVTGRLSVRGEVDFRRSRGENGADTARELRGVAGVVYRLF